MKNSRLLTTALVLGLSVALFVAPACAWEFSMDGVFTWQYELRGQTGPAGFFGQFDSSQTGAADVPGFYAPYNFYTGGFHQSRVTDANVWNVFAAYGGQASSLAGGEQIVSGSDAGWNVQYMSTNMQIRMNQALRIRGNYFIGNWTTPNSSVSSGLMVSAGLLNLDAPGVQRSFSPGYWRTLWLSAQLPWGELAIGKRPSSWGMGLTFDGADNRSSESLNLTTFYGPFRVGMSFYPSRRGYATDDYGTAAVWYNERADKNNTRVFDMTIPNVTYRSGPIDAGFYVNWMFRHRGGESILASPATAPAGTRTIQARDFQEQYGGVYLKYNNGRFFLNSEWAWYRSIENRIGRMAGTSSTTLYQITDPIHTENDSLVVEAGVLCGPSKVSILGGWFTGDDYRYLQPAGTTINGAQQQRVLVKGGKQPDTFSNTSIFRPYSYLMVYGYGLGTSFARDTGNGFVQDASIYAARLDYAVAANLNIYGSFTWAEKFSKSGDIWGCLVPTQTGAAPFQGAVAYVKGSNSLAFTVIPTIPDTALGYEIDGGFDWKLLEGLTARCTVGYWVPGKWFSYACVDKNVTGWYQPGNGTWANNFHTSPNKTIDPVWGTEFKVEGTF